MSILFADIFEAIRTLRVCKGTSKKEILKYVQERTGGCLSVNNKMFNYKYPLLEVVQAIEHLQESKGTTNTQVCEFVRKMAKKPNDPMKVIKTMCTLDKLVKEGVLVKKGKRYSLPKPPPKREDDDMEQEEEKDDECEEEEDDNMKDSCDDLGDDDEEEDCAGGDDDNDEDEEDDEDDEDEDDDDDDDDDQNMNKDDDEDDENCNDKAEEKKKEEKKGVCPEGEGEDEVEKRVTCNANGKGGNGELTCTTSFDNSFAAQKHSGAKKSKRHSGMINKAENVAFCVRDFMDLQYHSYSDAPGKMVDVMDEGQKNNEKSKEVANIFQARRRSSRSRQSHLSNPNYRSRSPVKGAAADALQHRLAMEACDEIGPLNNFKEAGDMELDVEPDKQEDFELFGRPSPIDPHPLNASGSLIDRRESCENGKDKKEVKPEAVVARTNQHGLKKHGEVALGVVKAKDKKSKKDLNDAKKEKHKRGTCHIKKIDDSKKSVCSFCDKKKKKKKN